MAMIKILVGTVYGGAREVADALQPIFATAGHQVEISEDPELSDLHDTRYQAILISCSTSGSGDFPPNFIPFYRALDKQQPALTHLRYGLIALGDSAYDQTFCEAGTKIERLFNQLGAQRIGQRLDIDASEHFQASDAALPWAERWLMQFETQLA